MDREASANTELGGSLGGRRAGGVASWLMGWAVLMLCLLSGVRVAAQVGPVVLRNQLDVAAYVLHGDEPFYILIEHDILAARSEIFVLDEVQLLLEPYRRPDRTGLYVGALYHFARTLRAQVQRQRVGLFGEWVFRPRLGPFARPRLLGLAGYHVEDRNRGGGFIGIVCMGSEFDL